MRLKRRLLESENPEEKLFSLKKILSLKNPTEVVTQVLQKTKQLVLERKKRDRRYFLKKQSR